MLTPPRALPENAHIAVLAASGPSERARIEEAAKAIESRGHRVTIAPNVDHRHRGYLAGDDDERADTLNRFFAADDYDAYFFARGGYGAMRILDRLDYAAILRNPRPIVGFSDVTALHQAIAVHAGVATFHGPMLNLDFHAGLTPEREQWLWSMLSGTAPMTHGFASSQVVCEGKAKGVLFGGCLALTDSLVGTPYDYWIDDGIWFWEDVEEPPYRLDRMLTHLRLTGRLRRIQGVVVGTLKACGEPLEINALLRDFFAAADIPVVRDLPFGHDGNNLLMPIGAAVQLDTHDGSLTITEPAVVR
ncbi:MAG: muramoyltetrapeptide carboxypeptidase [Acidobacteriota bacterium]|jgi:muramoyltetrapeptide carboxypeptidase|nr:muramoyltetrapeptide carboxypeptidase [Acidobacteriota bacterium]